MKVLTFDLVLQCVIVMNQLYILYRFQVWIRWLDVKCGRSQFNSISLYFYSKSAYIIIKTVASSRWSFGQNYGYKPTLKTNGNVADSFGLKFLVILSSTFCHQWQSTVDCPHLQEHFASSLRFQKSHFQVKNILFIVIQLLISAIVGCQL